MFPHLLNPILTHGSKEPFHDAGEQRESMKAILCPLQKPENHPQPYDLYQPSGQLTTTFLIFLHSYENETELFFLILCTKENKHVSKSVKSLI